jgi:predicted membrane chloride channel (bestrophin family)
MTQPVPFPYYHTLTLMLSLNLLMVSYSLIEFETILTIPCFFIIVLVTIGLKETSIALADPFGSADVDFETENYMAAVLANCKAIISPAADYTPMLLPIMAKKK